MESIVNYSSEEEPEESYRQKRADQSNNYNSTSNSGKRNRRSAAGMRNAGARSRSSSAYSSASAGNRSGTKDEANTHTRIGSNREKSHHQHRQNHHQRDQNHKYEDYQSRQHHYKSISQHRGSESGRDRERNRDRDRERDRERDRDNRDNRMNRDHRGGRGNNTRGVSSKDYQTTHHARDSYRLDNRRENDSHYRDRKERDEERNDHRHSGGSSSYNRGNDRGGNGGGGNKERGEKLRNSDNSRRSESHRSRDQSQSIEERSSHYQKNDNRAGLEKCTSSTATGGQQLSPQRTPTPPQPSTPPIRNDVGAERNISRYPNERPSNALEQARISAIEMERKLNMLKNPVNSDESKQAQTFRLTNSAEAVEQPKPLISRPPPLPLLDCVPKLPNVIAITQPSQGCLLTGGAQTSTDPAVIQLPSYYNPNVMNPSKYAQQMQKRKLLWSAKKTEDTTNKWNNAQFSQDSDGKVASKFMRLMGIKNSSSATPAVAVNPIEGQNQDVESREAMFSSMEQQYEVARQATHTMRGVGLGFSSASRPL